jgi:hypothetical protein
LNENKILQNADQNKAEELLKQAMITWGSQPMLGNDEDKKNAVTVGHTSTTI